MELLEQIINCKTDEEADEIIKNKIEIKNNEQKPVEMLGFLYGGLGVVSLHKGFIPLATKIRTGSSSIESYSMATTDFFYEFAHFIREYELKGMFSMVRGMETFINEYFGMAGANDRSAIFTAIANEKLTDDEYWAALENNKIGDLKGKGAAECTERAAVAQQLLSLFGMNTYYCISMVDLGDRQEAHSFNIVKRKKDYALLDYSLPVSVYNADGNLMGYYPFIGEMTNEEFDSFITDKELKSFDDYQYINTREIALLGGKKSVCSWKSYKGR